MSAFKKGSLVVAGAMILSVLGLQASDTLRGLDTGLTGLVNDAAGPCGNGATEMFFGSHALCVDVYEASASKECPNMTVTGQVETQKNMNSAECQTVSTPDVMPWRFVSLTQAQQLCARSSKRLPTNDEWYKIASGITEQSSCVIDTKSSPQLTGSANCVTPAGVHDIVGNVWEWVDAEVIDGSYNTRKLPDSGYVSMVDSNGVILETNTSASEEFGNDYAWTKSAGVFGVIRGGFYGSGDDAGIFSQNLAVPFDFKTAGVGFRCVRDI